MSNLLEGEPGQRYRVRNERPEQDVEMEVAEADDDGVLRDGKGRSYSAGTYSILEEVGDE